MSFPKYQTYKASGIAWLGNVPATWSVLPLKAVATCNDEVLPEGTDGDTAIEYVEISGVEEGRGITQTESLTFAAAPSRARRVVRHGDVLISTVRTYLRAIATVSHPPENLVASTGFAAIRPRSAHPGFLGYLLHCDYLVSEVIARSVGISYPAINASDLMRLKGPIPVRDEQAAIATFLDRETAKIDALVDEQKRLIGLLKEKRQAVISQAVTKGLNPDMPMKDSGVEWLGKVPEHWDVSRLRYVTRHGTSITYGIVQAGPHVEGGIPYIKTSDMFGPTLPLDGYSKTSAEIDASYARSKVGAGDLVIAIRASVGKCLPVPAQLEGANLTQGTAKISPGDVVDARYLLAYINARPVQTYLNSVSKGATFKEITLDTLRKTPVLLPPILEQRLIASQVHGLNEQFQELIDEANAAERLLLERRSALISAAVTGKIDVRGLVVQPEAVAA